MTPLIDVMLVLLVIFMVTAPLLSGRRGRSAEGEERADAGGRRKLLIIVTADEHVYSARTGSPAVEEKLTTNARLKEEKEVYIQADENVKYGAVLRVMAAARTAGVEKLGMITDPLEVR